LVATASPPPPPVYLETGWVDQKRCLEDASAVVREAAARAEVMVELGGRVNGSRVTSGRGSSSNGLNNSPLSLLHSLIRRRLGRVFLVSESGHVSLLWRC